MPPFFQPTVPKHIYQAVAQAAGEPFADSYLWGARLGGDKLMTRTVIAHERLSGRADAMRALTDLGVSLICPTPWPGATGDAISGREALPFAGWPEDRPTAAPPLFRDHVGIDEFLRGGEPRRG